MSRSYFLSPTAIGQLRRHKRWSLEKFGHIVTKKYFEDLDCGFQHIADNHERFPKRAELTGEHGFSIYPVREHYVVYVPKPDGVHIAAILGQAQDIPNILNDNAILFERELAQYTPLSIQQKRGDKESEHD